MSPVKRYRLDYQICNQRLVLMKQMTTLILSGKSRAEVIGDMEKTYANYKSGGEFCGCGDWWQDVINESRVDMASVGLYTP